MNNLQNFKKLVTGTDTKTIEKVKQRINNRARLRESQDIAMKVLDKLDELRWSQKMLAEAMNVKPQQITKIVSGKENLTLETQVKLQSILNIPILASYYENLFEEVLESIKFKDSLKYEVSSFNVSLLDTEVASKSEKFECTAIDSEFFEEYKIPA